VTACHPDRRPTRLASPPRSSLRACGAVPPHGCRGRHNENDWHRRSAERLVELAAIPAGSHVLDAATGTGFAALAAARAVGESGRVTGIDLSRGMLREAEAAARDQRVDVEWLQADATSLAQFANGSFDAVTCAAGLLYMPVDAALREWHRVLRPGGIIAFTSMRAGSPLVGRLFRDHAAEFGVALADPSLELGSPDACRTALERAGFTVSGIVEEANVLAAQDLAVAWQSNVKSPAHAAVEQLGSEQLEELRGRYMAGLARALSETPDALTRAEILYVLARRRAMGRPETTHPSEL
jgi:SAM-dependent methyltransferase